MIAVAEREHLVETASFLSKVAAFPTPATPKPRVAVLSSSGGTAIAAADTASRVGLALPQPKGATLAVLRRELPRFAAPRNPCDMTAQTTANPEMVGRCAAALLADPGFDALVIPWGKAWDSGQFGVLSDAALRHSKPVCLVWASQWLEGPGSGEAEAEPGLALFRSMTACMTALAAWARPPPRR